MSCPTNYKLIFPHVVQVLTSCACMIVCFPLVKRSNMLAVFGLPPVNIKRGHWFTAC